MQIVQIAPTALTIARPRTAIKCKRLCLLVLAFSVYFALSRFAMGAEGISNTPDALRASCKSHSVTAISPDVALERSQKSADDGLVDESASLAVTGICAYWEGFVGNVDYTELAANAVERLLEAGDVSLAFDLLESDQLKTALEQPIVTPQLLRLRMAAARGMAYQHRNQEAIAVRQALQDEINLKFGIDSNEAIENELRISNLTIELGKVAIGLSDLKRLEVLSKSLPQLKRRIRISVVESEAIGLALSGQEAEALDRLKYAKNLLTEKGSAISVRALDIEEEIASILLRSERHEEALTSQSEVFLQRQANFPNQRQRIRQSLWRLGFIYLSLQRIGAADAIFRYLDSNLQNDPDHQSRLLSLETTSRLADIAARRGKFLDAADKWKKVYEGETDLLGSDSPDTLIEEANYAVALSHVGEASLACSRLRDVLARQQAAHPDDLWVNEFTRISLARCLSLPGRSQDLAGARQLLLEAWSTLAASARRSGGSALYAIDSLAQIDLKVNQRDEAKELLVRLVNQVEMSRRDQSVGLASRDEAFSTWVEGLLVNGEEVLGYRELALLHAQDDELERALRVSELARDRALRDRFAEQEWLRQQVPLAERRRLEPLIEEIQSLDERLAVASDLMERVRLESQRTIAVARRGRMERDLRERLHLGTPDSPPPTLDALRAHLDGSTVLVSVMHAGEVWWALLISRDAPARFVVLADADLGRNATAWLRRLRGEPVRAWPMPQGRLAIEDLRPADATGPYLSTAQLAERLAHALLMPLTAALGDARHIVFVGDDELVGVPLQALPLGPELALDRFDISYAPSLTTYARWQGRAPSRRARDLLAIGAINYPHRAATVADDTAAIGLEFAADHPLPQTGSEITAIGRLFPAGRQTLMTGTTARKAALRAASLSGELARYRYVHLATHAWADAERPEASAVVLASDGTEPPLQVVLTAAELAGLRMSADLIVLSACDTGSGHFEHGRGLLGLAYAALAAGNRAALLSLWSIDDATTAPFMVRFYQHLTAGQGPVAALAATQREFRHSRDPGRSDPAAWAPFLIYGGY